jgi:hypothetical protein
LLVLLCAGCAAPSHAQSPPPQPAAPAAPDAIIELWEQDWTLNPDGSTVYHEKKHVRLNSERAYGEFADPRITYSVDTDKLEVLQARTRLPDGSYRELPDYARVTVGPDGATGWPAFAGLRQQLLVMSGVQPGCVLELEYRITSKPGARRYLAADLQLDHQYPVLRRSITVSTPSEVPLRYILSGVSQGVTDSPSGARRWTFENLAPVPHEPQSPPWQINCGRLAFSTAGKASDWLKARMGQLEAATDKSELLDKLATEWTKDRKDSSDKLRGLQEKLAASFNFVDLPVDWRPATIRPASEVIQCNYGLPEEAAAVLLALARAASLPVLPGLLVSDDTWHHEVPQDRMVAAYVVLLIVGRAGDVHMVEGDSGSHAAVLDTGDEPEIWDPRQGRILRAGRWAGYTLLPVPDVLMPRTLLPAWTDADESRCSVYGKVTVNEDGTLAGELSLRTTGLFLSPESLRNADAQKARIGGLLGRVLPDLNVESFSVSTLSVGEFVAVARVKSGKPLKKLDQRHLLQLAADGPFLADVPMPLAFSRRQNPVRLAGAFDEQIDLTIEWPDNKWSLEVRPSSIGRVAGEWGSIEQGVSVNGHSLRVQRHTRVEQRDLPAKDFLALRGPANELRSEHARTLVLKP